MRYAETGYNLEIDLTRGNIEKVATDPELKELYLEGQGTAGTDGYNCPDVGKELEKPYYGLVCDRLR